MIQKNKVSGNKEEKETENLGEKRAEYFMIDAQSSKYLKYFPECCEQVTDFYMHSFKNGNADMKKIKTHHPSTQNNRLDGTVDGLMTPGLFHRAFFLLVSVLAIIHKQDFNDIFVKIYLGTHSSKFIAARMHDKAVALLGNKKLNFKSEEDFEDKFNVAVDTELIKKQESMSKEEWAKFDQGSFIAQYIESIPLDAVIKGVIEYDLTWKESVKRNGVLENSDYKE